MSYFPETYSHSKNKTKVELYLSKTQLKSDVSRLVIDKSKTSSVLLSKLNSTVQMMLLKRVFMLNWSDLCRLDINKSKPKILFQLTI